MSQLFNCQELLPPLNYRIEICHLSKLIKIYRHYELEVCGFFKFVVQQFTAANHKFLLKALLRLSLRFIVSFFEFKNYCFINWTVIQTLIFDTQPI
jgi:hypothetical protein